MNGEKPGLIEQIMWPNGRPIGAGAKLDAFGDPIVSPFQPVTPASREETTLLKQKYDNPTIVAPARHLGAPEGAETVDPRKLDLTVPGDDYILWSFQCPAGATTVFYRYVLFTDAVDASTIEFIPTIDGRRILGRHGDPTDNLKLNLAVGIDLAEESSIPCQVFMQPGQIVRWRVINNAPNPVSMGVRMIGYLDYGQRLTSSKLGG